MKEISSTKIMQYWNNSHPNNPCLLKDVEEYLETHAFFNLSPSILVKIMERNFMI